LLGINLDGVGNPTPNTSEADLFSYKLDYETAGFYDGNIGKETWKTFQNTGSNRSYTYDYDKASRLLSSSYAGGMFANENFSLSNITYDKNGNMLNFWRNGMTSQSNNSPTAFGFVDKMTYQYNGNRLNGIKDDATNSLDVGDFKDNGNFNDYTYYADGSLKSDANKGISLIEWDSFLSKQKQINYSDGRWIKHFYDGSGKRIQTTDSENTVWDYLADAVYKNGVLYQISDDEGRILFENNNYSYEFSYKDHLGNARVSFKNVGGQLTLTQENAYYPFGLSHTGTDFTLGINANNYLYNGKEKINSFGLNYSDYGFRTLDLQNNRFVSVDHLASQYAHNGVYNYAENRPINGIDLDGLEFFSTVENKITVIGARVKFENTSSANSKRVDAIKNDIQVRFNEAIKSANSSYEGKIIFDDKATLSIQLSEQTSESSIKGIGGLGEANIVNNDYTSNGSKEKTIGNVAVNGIHELLHNGGLGHPTDVTRDKNGNLVSDNPVKDTELQLINNGNGTFEYKTTPNTAKNIFTNIMQYGRSIINGKQVNNVRGGNENAKTVTPGQLKVVEDNIKKGLVNGEASN
jgi:RHS repeat-associated protein